MDAWPKDHFIMQESVKQSELACAAIICAGGMN